MLVELKGVDTNNGSVEARCKLGLFYIVCTNMVYKTLVFLHRINNTEHNIKQNIYPGMEVICLIRPCQYRYFDTSSMILYIKRVTLKNDASNKMTNFQRDLFLKEHYWRWWISILFSILSIIVFVISYSHVWNKIRKLSVL